MAVINPASPIIDFSIKALQGQTVTQWPQETQLDSPIGLPPSHKTRGCDLPSGSRAFRSPADLAGLHTPPTQDTLVRVVPIEWIGFVDFVRLGTKGNFLVLNLQQLQSYYERCNCRCCYRKRYSTKDGFLRSGRRPLAELPFGFRGCGEHRHPCETIVPQARASWPFTSTKQVSHVWIGPSCG